MENCTSAICKRTIFVRTIYIHTQNRRINVVDVQVLAYFHIQSVVDHWGASVSECVWLCGALL